MPLASEWSDQTWVPELSVLTPSPFSLSHMCWLRHKKRSPVSTLLPSLMLGQVLTPVSGTMETSAF